MKMSFRMQLDLSTLSLSELDDLHKYVFEARKDRCREYMRLVNTGGVANHVYAIFKVEGKLAAVKYYRELMRCDLIAAVKFVDEAVRICSL